MNGAPTRYANRGGRGTRREWQESPTLWVGFAREGRWRHEFFLLGLCRKPLASIRGARTLSRGLLEQSPGESSEQPNAALHLPHTAAAAAHDAAALHLARASAAIHLPHTAAAATHDAAALHLAHAAAVAHAAAARSLARSRLAFSFLVIARISPSS